MSLPGPTLCTQSRPTATAVRTITVPAVPAGPAVAVRVLHAHPAVPAVRTLWAPQARRYTITFGLVVTVISCGPSDSRPPFASESRSTTNLVLLDGRFDDWVGVPDVLNDPDDAPGAPVDLGRVQATSDGRYIYLSLETGTAVNAQAMDGSVLVLLDADDDPDTGEDLHDLPGVDLVLELSRSDVARPSGRGTGIGVRVRGPNGRLEPTVQAGQLDVIVTPTYAADRFESRIARGHEPPGGPPLLVGSRARLALIYEKDGRTIDRTAAATVDLAPYDEASFALWADPLAPGPDVVRVLVWNVSHTSFRDHPERFAPVLRALEPDVVLMDEVHRDVTTADLRRFFTTPPLAETGAWDFVAGTSGGTQMTVVASRIGLRPEPSMAGVDHHDDSLDALVDVFSDSAALSEFEMERDRGIPTVGAWVDIGGHPVLMVPIDLKSAGHDGSWEDRLREVQAARVRERVAAVLGSAPSPVSAVIGGDLNLVGSRRPLDIMVRGLDGGADLVPAAAYRLTDRSLATWRNNRQPFTPGRLDFVLVPERTLDVRRAFTFDATELDSGFRDGLGISADATSVTSDHLPIVVDLAFRRSAS